MLFFFEVESQGGALGLKPPHLVVRHLGWILIHQVVATAMLFGEHWAAAPAAFTTSHGAAAVHKASPSIQTQQLPTV